MRGVGECNKGEDICVIYYPHHLFSLVFLPNWEDKIMWAWRDYFPHHFLFLLFSLLNQTRENSIFHPIFLSFFSILPVFTPTKRGLREIAMSMIPYWQNKLGGFYIYNSDSLFYKVFKACFFPTCSIMEAKNSHAGSHTWTSILHERDVLLRGR